MKERLIFTKGFVYQRNLFFVQAVLKSLEEQNQDHAFMFRWKDGNWSQWNVKHRIVDFTVFENNSDSAIVLLSNDGQLQTGSKKGFSWERIDESEDSPNHLRGMTCLTCIDDSLFAAGMQRMVYQKNLKTSEWERIDSGVRVGKDSTEISGFSAISGISENSVYAAGLTGQLWHYNGSTWSQLNSGTTLGLHDIEIINNDEIYICGNSGVVLRGNRTEWEIVRNNATKSDFYSLARLGNRLFLSTDSGRLYEIKNGEIIPVKIELDSEVTTYSLQSNDGVMLSVGSDHIVVFDGRDWTNIVRPDA